jgi:cytochrome c-type biogenesis protein CcmH/NrfG
MSNVNERLEKVIRLQAKRWENKDHWDEINELLITELQDILRTEPQNTSAYINLGAVLCDSGEYKGALAALKIAEQLGSEDKNLYTNLAIVMVDMGKDAEEYHEYLEIAENFIESPLTFKAYFDPQAY